MEPIAVILAVNATRRHVHSARPDAPVVPYRTGSINSVLGPTRLTVARILRRLADGLERGHPAQANCT
jgi:hypothetical protein